jgi:hypothetical protein
MQIILMQVIVGGNLGDADAENAADEERDPSLEQTPETPFVSNDSAGAAASTIIKGQSATPAKQAGVPTSFGATTSKILSGATGSVVSAGSGDSEQILRAQITAQSTSIKSLEESRAKLLVLSDKLVDDGDIDGALRVQELMDKRVKEISSANDVNIQLYAALKSMMAESSVQHSSLSDNQKKTQGLTRSGSTTGYWGWSTPRDAAGQEAPQ